MCCCTRTSLRISPVLRRRPRRVYNVAAMRRVSSNGITDQTTTSSKKSLDFLMQASDKKSKEKIESCESMERKGSGKGDDPVLRETEETI